MAAGENGTSPDGNGSSTPAPLEISSADEVRKEVTTVWPHEQPLPRIPIIVKDWTATTVIGIFVVSHWRGVWTLFDLWTCDQPESATLAGGENFCWGAFYALPPEELAEIGIPDNVGQIRLDSGITTYWLGVIFTLAGVAMVWRGLWKPPPGTGKVTRLRAFVRFIIVLVLGFAAVFQWRGIWYVTDHLILPDTPEKSYWLTTVVGAAGAYILCSGAALLAPPFIFLIDGPGEHQPPIAVTIISSYYSLALPAYETPPTMSPVVLLLDFIVTFFGLPILVVWFWRGLWLLLDLYFWGFTVSQEDVTTSLVYGTILAIGCAVIGSEPILYFVPEMDQMMYGKYITPLVGRLRTLVLAIGNVSFWRVVWSTWDLGGTTYASAWSSEVCSVFLLTVMGCVSSIAAPPSTIGVDVTPNPKCHDEPLFSMLPVPWELLVLFGIARQPEDAIGPLPSPPPSPPEIETSAESVTPPPEIETPAESEKDDAKASTSSSCRRRSIGSSIAESIRSAEASYFDAQRPGIGHRKLSGSLSQRPELGNVRHRSSFHRSR